LAGLFDFYISSAIFSGKSASGRMVQFLGPGKHARGAFKILTAKAIATGADQD